MSKVPSREAILRAVVHAIKEVQEAGGHSLGRVPSDLRPVGDLEGFDSVTGVEATVLLEEKLEVDIDTETVFVSSNGQSRALNIEEIVDAVTKHAKWEAK